MRRTEHGIRRDQARRGQAEATSLGLNLKKRTQNPMGVRLVKSTQAFNGFWDPGRLDECLFCGKSLRPQRPQTVGPLKPVKACEIQPRRPSILLRVPQPAPPGLVDAAGWYRVRRTA